MSGAKMRDVAAYMLDRADQYDTDSPCWYALVKVAENVMRGEVEAAKRNGDFDAELYARVDSMAGRPRAIDEQSIELTRAHGKIDAVADALVAAFGQVEAAIHRQKRAGKSQHIGQAMALATFKRICGPALRAIGRIP